MVEPEGPLDQDLMIKRFDPLYWKHAIWKVFSGASMVFLGSLPTVILGWDTMLPSGKLVAVSGLAISVIKSIDMLFDQTMSRLAAGKLPVKLDGQNGHDTALTKKPDSP